MSETEFEVGESGFRRLPKQERSRERVEEILAAARRLIGEKGIDSVKMREIGALAGGPISSIYQYFPHKSAIVATLFSQWTSEIEGMISSRVDSVNGLADLDKLAGDLLDYYYSRVSSDPAILDVLNAIQADKTLQMLDIESTLRQAQAFCDKGYPFIAEELHDEFHRATVLLFHLANGAVRLAMADSGNKCRVLGDFKKVISRQLMHFSRTGNTE